MRKTIILALSFILYGLLPTTVIAQSIVSVIPYELFGRKMIINMRVKDKTERFIFDTGAEKSAITSNYFEASSLPILDSINLRDSNSNSQLYKQTKLDAIATTDNKITFNNVPVSVIDGSTLECFNVAGLLGSDLLTSLICTIDPKEKTITLTSAEKRSSESLRYAHSFQGPNYMPVIEGMVNGEPINMLFDTGCSAFLLLSKSQHSRLDSLSAIKTIDFGSGSGSIGIGGLVIDNSIKKIGIRDFRIGLAKFSNLVLTTSGSQNTLLGMAILNYGKIVIDYPRRLFYYIPFSNETVKLGYTPRKFDIKVLDGKLVVATVWSEMENVLSTNDLITHINGKPTGTYDFCDSFINGIEDLKVKTPIMMTIMTKEGKQIEIEY